MIKVKCTVFQLFLILFNFISILQNVIDIPTLRSIKKFCKFCKTNSSNKNKKKKFIIKVLCKKKENCFFKDKARLLSFFVKQIFLAN